MNLTGTLLETYDISANDIDRDPFGNKINQNYSVINEMSMGDVDRDHFGNKFNPKLISDRSSI